MRYPPCLQISIQKIESKRHRGDADGKCGGFLASPRIKIVFPAMATGGLEEERQGVDDGAVEVVDEIRENEDLGSRVGVVLAKREEEEGEPEGGALHEEPG